MNSILIEYAEPRYRKLAPRKEVSDFLRAVCREEGIDGAEFSVTFIGEEEMHALNRQYRGIDDSTDILSFAAQDGNEDFAFIAGPRRYRNLGDILICPEVFARNAEEFHVSFDEELHRLLIHGVLHLNGMDHKSNDSSEPMLRRQEDILIKLYSQIQKED